MTESNLVLEQQLTRGQVLWVTQLSIDLCAGTVELACTSKPESGKPDRHVLFSGVRNLRYDRLDEFEPDYLSSFLGLHTNVVGWGARYQINTDTCELTFDANANPTLELSTAA